MLREVGKMMDSSKYNIREYIYKNDENSKIEGRDRTSPKCRVTHV